MKKRLRKACLHPDTAVRIFTGLAIIWNLAYLPACNGDASSLQYTRPNILLILADDLG